MDEVVRDLPKQHQGKKYTLGTLLPPRNTAQYQAFKVRNNLLAAIERRGLARRLWSKEQIASNVVTVYHAIYQHQGYEQNDVGTCSLVSSLHWNCHPLFFCVVCGSSFSNASNILILKTCMVCEPKNTISALKCLQM